MGRDCQCDVSAAAQHLAQLPSKCCPLEKLSCLMSCHEAVERAVEGGGGGGALTTDSLLPLTARSHYGALGVDSVVAWGRVRFWGH